MVPRRRNRLSRFYQLLQRLLIHRHDGKTGIVGYFIQVQHRFYSRHERRIGLRRDHPIFNLAVGHVVFLVCAHRLCADRQHDPKFHNAIR